MSPFRYRDDESSSTGTVLGVLAGAVAGFAVGMFVAQRVGGIDGLDVEAASRRGRASADETLARRTSGRTTRTSSRTSRTTSSRSRTTTRRSKSACSRRSATIPILAERAIDIGSIGDGVIELAGWVEDEEEAQHAVTIARGVPGRRHGRQSHRARRRRASIRRRRAARARRRSVADRDALGRRRVGTGRRRQGTSDEPIGTRRRRSTLEDRWQSADDAMRNAADDIEGRPTDVAREARVRGDRTGGSPSRRPVSQGGPCREPLKADRTRTSDAARTRAAGAADRI